MENNYKPKEPVLSIGDLVFYQPSEMNRYANGEKQMGIVLEIIPDVAPLFGNLPDAELWMYEYKIKWIETGYVSKLHAFNLKKVEVPLDKESKT